jgi:anti-anti-sigma factor
MKASSAENEGFISVRYDPAASLCVMTFMCPRIEEANSEELLKRLRLACDRAAELQKFDTYLFSFRGVEFVDSAGISLLVRIWKHVGTTSATNICFCNCSQRLEQVFRTCKLHFIFNIYSDEVEARRMRGVEGFI